MQTAVLAVLLASLPTLQHGVAPIGSGNVVAAPHEGFDEHTAPLARAVAKALGWGWVVATDYRAPKELRWFDVNRPTQRPEEDGELQKARVTDAGREVYAEYQARLQKASNVAAQDRLALLVELHGHARVIRPPGRDPLRVQVIELATQGFTKKELRRLKRRYLRLLQTLKRGDRIPLAVEQLDPTYKFAGHRLKFYFRASGSKRAGSLSAARTERALHFELPSKIRFDERRRDLYAKLLAALLRGL